MVQGYLVLQVLPERHSKRDHATHRLAHDNLFNSKNKPVKAR